MNTPTNAPTLVQQLIDALQCLQGVGPRSAQRMAFGLLERRRTQALHLANVLERSLRDIQYCQQCRTWSETAICRTCANDARDSSLLCVVESPIDEHAIEQTRAYNGYYFVLMGRLSPLDGIGPRDIGLDLLLQRVANSHFAEIIIATNHTVEGEATAQYIVDLFGNHAEQNKTATETNMNLATNIAQTAPLSVSTTNDQSCTKSAETGSDPSIGHGRFDQLKITRLAQGIPLGGELELTDMRTLASAILQRRPMDGV